MVNFLNLKVRRVMKDRSKIVQATEELVFAALVARKMHHAYYLTTALDCVNRFLATPKKKENA